MTGFRTWWRRLTRYEVITRDDSIDYLARWRLLRTRRFCLYLHRFLAPDDACMHDHPWAFTSIVISGGYWEEWEGGVYAVKSFRWRGLGSVAHHPADYIHRVDALHPRRPTYTLILRTRRIREWGFRTPTGWVPHHKYSAREHC